MEVRRPPTGDHERWGNEIQVMALVDLAFLNKGGRDRFGKFALWSMGARYIDRG